MENGLTAVHDPDSRASIIREGGLEPFWRRISDIETNNSKLDNVTFSSWKWVNSGK